jgi:septal ring factor EnvC (AmiA/AmiB activator)
MTLKKTLTQHLRLIYQLGQTPSLKAFLSPDNIHTTNRHVTYYHYINEARVKLMENIKQTLTELDANMAALGEQEQTLRTLLAVKQQQQQQLVSAKAKRVQIMAQLNKISSSKKVELASLTNSQKNLKTMLVSMEDQDLNLPSLPFKDLQGKLPWPIKTAELPPATPSTDSSGHFSGMIIKVAEGTPVRSIYAGKVIYAKNMPGYGLLVIVNHGDGFMSLYARNHAVFTHVGETVKPGDIIASSGKSGGFSDPSLYFEIRRNGASVDPHNWCV